ncbi:PREDICTED: ADP-ribosylation factor GTPase-activating protein AGD1-like [Lupinus angustifolius]|uniref:ADP-ribosylation factor GTPase-activating protein AGD1-like n=1 Tax=Lupinus angustifolius TaxID=3871 RepID=UPI00092EE98B|nr:PREDICTED: ADP-ribosylation factor GTPase-activating protein AGD1-like [Lupinus angustifolius]
MYFQKLQDSPMFRQQLQIMEESSEALRSRCWKFYKGCQKYTEGLAEAYDGDIAFASAVENFVGGHNDPLFVTLGGPVMAKFTIALREISTHKELLRSEVEHMLNDRLLNILNVEILDVKEARRRFDKSSLAYDQAREKFMSLRKSTKFDTAAVIEEELHNARNLFEEARFNLVSALHNIEAKKRFEFLEAVTAVMDAHLRYFQQGYQLFHEMEPFILEVLAYAQKSRESANEEQISLCERMVQYKQLVHEESRLTLNGPYSSAAGDGMQHFCRISNKVVDAVTESAANGKIQIIRQGYLSKRSSNLRGDWKRRYFVLDSRGMLYYYRKPLIGLQGGNQPCTQRNFATENSSGILSRLLSSQYHGVIPDDRSVARHTVNLLTSTIKIDAEQSDLRFCFRIISPSKMYTLQAENALDQMDWMEKITGVIASLLSAQILETPRSVDSEGNEFYSASKFELLLNSSQDDPAMSGDFASKNFTPNSSPLRTQGNKKNMKGEKPIDVLRKVSGNDKCADCGKPEPDWASLNLGILLCIECSGVHRNLGVHMSKVRSLTLDVKVWDSPVLTLFQSLGNLFANSVWEELLHSTSNSVTDDTAVCSPKATRNKLFHARKPEHDDPISLKERFIHAKYAEKVFVRRVTKNNRLLSVAQQVWESICANDKKAVYRHIIRSDVDVNAINGQALDGDSFITTCSSNSNISPQSIHQLMEDIQEGSSVLHLACLTCDAGMVELLLQCGAAVNAIDSRGRTPLHYCILRGKIAAAKVLITRGGNPNMVDKEGNTPLKFASELCTVSNEVDSLLTGTR